jgi:hypothetical protein
MKNKNAIYMLPAAHDAWYYDRSIPSNQAMQTQNDVLKT